jgi:hypothetical protein
MPLQAAAEADEDDLYGSPISPAIDDIGSSQVVGPEEQAQAIRALEEESWPHRAGDPMALISYE